MGLSLGSFLRTEAQTCLLAQVFLCLAADTPPRAETFDVDAPRYAWLNTIVGIIDSAFRLSDEELYATNEIVQKLLEALNIPDRGQPRELPLPLAMEIAGGYYSIQIHEPRQAGLHHVPRYAEPGDVVVSLEAWRQSLVGLLEVAYPDLDPLEIIAATKILDELLLSLGLPDRASCYLPEDVVRAHVSGA